MLQSDDLAQAPTALITGSARRIGKAIAEYLHRRGYNLLLHFQQSDTAMLTLCEQLNATRQHSAHSFRADLSNTGEVEALADWAKTKTTSLGCLINNASVFVADQLQAHNQHFWQDTLQVNTHAAYQLSVALQDQLASCYGNVINLVDVYAERPLKGHTVYSTSKAANAMLVKSLALEMAPRVRVNGIAPGAILWPENSASNGQNGDSYQDELLHRVPLRRLGNVDAITCGIGFILDCDYLSGQIINIDGGRSITI
jgi:pteridine reductase